MNKYNVERFFLKIIDILLNKLKKHSFKNEDQCQISSFEIQINSTCMKFGFWLGIHTSINVCFLFYLLSICGEVKKIFSILY